MFPGEHPGHVDHERQDNFDRAVAVDSDAVDQGLAMVGQAARESRGCWHEERGCGGDGGEEEGGTGAGEGGGVEGGVEAPAGVGEVVVEARFVGLGCLGVDGGGGLRE